MSVQCFQDVYVCSVHRSFCSAGEFHVHRELYEFLVLCPMCGGCYEGDSGGPIQTYFSQQQQITKSQYENNIIQRSAETYIRVLLLSVLCLTQVL